MNPVEAYIHVNDRNKNCLSITYIDSSGLTDHTSRSTELVKNVNRKGLEAEFYKVFYKLILLLSSS